MTYKIEDYTSDQWQSAYRKWVATPLNKEEEALMKEFKNYKNYRKEVGMFFPKLKR